MEIKPFLNFTERKQLREWLEKNYMCEKCCWVPCNRSKETVPNTISYTDIVEEVLCFGWIDSTLKKMPDGRLAQRLSPRKKKSHWTQLNIKRCKELKAKGLMTKAGIKALPKEKPPTKREKEVSLSTNLASQDNNHDRQQNKQNPEN